MHAAERWRGRAATLEAIAWVAVARILVARVPLARWRGTLGAPAQPDPGDPHLRLAGNLGARRLARAVGRAAERLPGESACLPQAMALQWMLGCRGLSAMVVLGVRPAQHRGGIDDLHAWVVRDGEVLIGALAALPYPVYAAQQQGK